MFWVFDAAQTILLTIMGISIWAMAWVTRPVWDRYKEDQKK
ncbi:hypothetical protein [Domibacillus indicus]|nr:hypothetical protein [Domibacillus indicus]